MEEQLRIIADLKVSLADLIRRSDDAIKQSQEAIDRSEEVSKRIWRLLILRDDRVIR